MKRHAYLIVSILLVAPNLVGAQNRAGGRNEVCSAERFPKHFTDWRTAHPSYDAAVEPIREGQLHEGPVRRQSPALEYPRQAQRDRYEGTVLLEAVIGVEGRVVFAEVLESTVRRVTPLGVARDREDRLRGPPDPVLSSEQARRQFEAAALELLLKSVFEPGRVDQQPVASLICLPIEFRIH